MQGSGENNMYIFMNEDIRLHKMFSFYVEIKKNIPISL